jgi:hypothetical protein
MNISSERLCGCPGLRIDNYEIIFQLASLVQCKEDIN